MTEAPEKAPRSLADFSEERTMQGAAVLSAAIQALTVASSPQEAMLILQKAIQLIPDMAATPEFQAAFTLGLKLGKRREEQHEGHTTCLDCGAPIERGGERGMFPRRCANCADKRRHARQAEHARTYRQRAKARTS